MTRVISSSLSRGSGGASMRSVRPPSRPGPGLLASGSSYSPRLPGRARPVVFAGFVPGYSCGAAPAWHRLPSCPGACTARVSRSSSHRPCWFTAGAPFGARGHKTVGELGTRGEMKMHVAHERALHDISLRALLAVAWTQAVGARDRVGQRVDSRGVKLVTSRPPPR